MKPFTKISSLLFGIIALIHLLRLISQFEITISNTLIPLWANVVGLIVASVLCWGLWKESRQ